MTRVDGIIKSINKMVNRLEEAAQFHFVFASDQEDIVRNAQVLANRHNDEGKRALAIKTKIESLITV